MTADRNIELNQLGRTLSPADGGGITVRGPGRSSVSDDGPSYARSSSSMKSRVNRFIDSFRREEPRDGNSLAFTVTDADGEPAGNAFDNASGGVSVVREHRGGRYYDLRSANSKTASTLLARELKGRHLQMIAISGSIGTGLFVASGKALSQGGPGSVLLAYLLVGIMLYCTVQALGELAVVFPVAGSFSAFSTRFLDPSWGFAMGWK
jgi:amino acid transporter